MGLRRWLSKREHWLWKHGGLSLDPQHLQKNPGVALHNTCKHSAGGEGAKIIGVYWLLAKPKKSELQVYR